MATRNKSTHEGVVVKPFTVSEIDVGIKKLKRRIEEINTLGTSNVRYDDARVKTAETNIRETIRDVFGQQSPEFRDYQYYEIHHGGHNIYDQDYDRQNKYIAGIGQAILALEGLIARFEEKRADLVDGPAISAPIGKKIDSTKRSRRVFIVHGHDEQAKQEVARFLEKLELEAVILSERPDQGRTIIEKFEANSDVEFAVILMTPDDIGTANSEPSNMRPRARQNVILELGYFVGRLSRSHVCALYKGSVEIPSDFHGVIYITMDEGEGWRLKLAREMRQAGLGVDMNLVL